ncbi:MAG: class I SAM-dependent RNA methyltransferase [Verrucomicrobia bacterium]|nr:class I SAM-dependent RNA methyltransferase [Verrucomicrobiota bacterium]
MCFVGQKKKFNNHPFGYHQEIELDIATLTNHGVGLGRVALAGHPGVAAPAAELPPAKPGGPALRPVRQRFSDGGSPGEGGWVVMVPFTLPGERVRARVFRNHKNYSEADVIEILTPSPHRVAPRCPLFGRCGGCQYQHLAYAEQLLWKQRQVAELLEHMAGVTFAVAPVVASPREFGYRSKITPHFHCGSRIADCGNESPIPIGFLRQGSRFALVDVPRCEIATPGINEKLAEVRAETRRKIAAGNYRRGATLLLRDAQGGVTTDYDAVITEEIALENPQSAIRDPQSLTLHFLARDFFQNNPFILPAFTRYVREQAAASGARYLVDAYCGSGLFALAAAPAFERVTGIEISETSVRFARENAAANGVANATFTAGDAAAIFAGLEFPPADTAVIIDPPRKGCDAPFLAQLVAFGPRAVVYVSCDPATQMRDLRHFLAAGYTLTAAQPFDLFPQTRHLECVLTLQRTSLAQT